MDRIRLKNFRCFREEQTVPLAPLTLLVGENSTGKTSFMAMIRALWDVAYGRQVPDFKEDPYDLGSFDEIVYRRGGRGGRADTFEAEFNTFHKNGRATAAGKGSYCFSAVFGKKRTTPVPVRRRTALGGAWIESRLEDDRTYAVYLGTPRGSWRDKASYAVDFDVRMMPVTYPLWELTRSKSDKIGGSSFIPLSDSPVFGSEDRDALIALRNLDSRYRMNRPFASAPVRSKPRRTYDPARTTPDPEGDYIPMHIANEYFRDKAAWRLLKKQIEEFGKDAGLFNEISIKTLGKRESEPFQLQVRKFAGKLKGPRHNLIDVGYGVSQVLPVIIELWRGDAPRMFLLQQPEVHLHPSAQAALGSLFCRAAAQGRQLIVETHSDHLMDRVRMEVRDGGSGLKPEDVSLLYFERGKLDVRIHSLRFDKQGNVLGAPPSYRRFFMEETERSLWKRS